jgi:hypothetical protein
MKRDKYWLYPKKGKVERGIAEAWWYANAGGIEVHIKPSHDSRGWLDGDHVVVKLQRASLKKYVAKSAL